MTHQPTLTKTSTLLLVHYQISYGDGHLGTDNFLACRLMVNGNEETSARSIDSAGIYGTSSGTWIRLGAGSPVIKVQCAATTA